MGKEWAIKLNFLAKQDWTFKQNVYPAFAQIFAL